MAKVQEKELSQYLETFNSKDIEIRVEGLFNQVIKLQFAECSYNTKGGKVKIHDNNTSFEIDISFVSLIDIDKELNKLNFYVENDTKITIAK